MNHLRKVLLWRKLEARPAASRACRHRLKSGRSPRKMMYMVDELRVLFMARKCISSC